MHSQVGSRFIEYIWTARGGAAPEVLERLPFWSSDPSARYFRALAHAGVKTFYRADHPHSEQILVEGASRTVFPEAVRIVDQDGKEICRWTTADEYEEIQAEC